MVTLLGGCRAKNSEHARPAAVTGSPGSKPQTTSEEAAQTAPAQTQPPAGASGDMERKYEGPPVSVRIVQAKRMPPISTALIEVTVPTGGWSFTLDKAQVTGDTAKIYLTLEKPGEGQWVTQSLATLNQTYTSENPPFTRAQVYVHLAQQGIHTLTTDYRLAAAAN